MGEVSQDAKPSISALFRHRSPTFSQKEIKTLLDIIEKYKTIVFNKSTSAAACSAKESTWVKIGKIFNSQGFTHHRSVDSLKIKWDNLKKEARKISKNLIDFKYAGYSVVDDAASRIVAMMCEAENNTSNVDEPAESDGELNDSEGHKEMASEEAHWNGNENKDSEDSSDAEEKQRLVNRSLNFSPKECNLLLQCVRREKNIVLAKTNSANAIRIKSRAWSRITNSYNKLSPQKRSTKMLRTKFTNMKRLASNVNLKGYIKTFGKKHENLEVTDQSSKEIKTEPLFDPYQSQDVDDVEDSDSHETSHEQSNHVDSSLDPLRSVLNSDFATGSVNQLENKEIVKLKTELLNYKMETAKRKRIEDMMQADALDRESKAIETSLRLRAARLEVVTAEMKLPPNHHALLYTAEEARGQHYTHQYHAT